MHRTNPGQHFDAGAPGQQFASDGTRSDPADGLPGARPAATLPVANAELGFGGEVGMGRSEAISEVGVGPWPGVLVGTTMAIGVPRVRPSKVPLRIST